MKKLLFGLLLALLCGPLAAAEVTVYAAASLVDALSEVAQAYKAVSQDTVHLSFAASSTLARQIEQGAPATLFISADDDWMNYLSEKRLIVESTRVTLLGNRLVLVVAADRPIKVDIKAGFDLAGVLGESRLAVGDPAGVPAGKYARQALTQLGVWPVAQTRLLRADSVRAALLYVQRGEAVAGIVYSTDAASSKAVTVAGEFPESSHKPIVYPAALIQSADSPAARALLQFLQGPEARAIFARHGFTTN